MGKIPINPIAFGTIGGTFLSMVPNLKLMNLLESMLLAAVGAIVSFLVSLLMKRLFKKH